MTFASQLQNESKTPQDRATTFQPVEGGGETRSGSLLLVEAYAVLWLILMAWLVILWRKQSHLHQHIAGLEAAIDRAEKKRGLSHEPGSR